MTYKMTDTYRKVLTEMIGEKFHKITTELNPDCDGWMWSTCICGKDKWFDHSLDACHRNRTFQTDHDMMKVFRHLKKERLFIKFMTGEIVCAELKQEDDYWNLKGDKHVIEWLMDDAERFCVLVAQWKMEGGI